ncbi:MAG: ligand-binding protein, RmlD family [Candidatus Marinimicrobia bacterium]|nr:ligand-binding protein, RmlD family [Candidatus Neomarinimicrobiota bacterium]|tara:strand:- start:22097 stop:22810 length:714 start_codon:yes stop_codon:yes gene_type:complete
MQKKKKIVVTGGTGRFGSVLKRDKFGYNMLFPNKKLLNITKFNTIKKYLVKTKPHCLIHLAGLSRPMKIHEKNISKSIELNIIGTANIVRACQILKIKLIYFSTSYVYPGTKGNYKETDPLLPSSNYAWSKLGGESAVQMYKNSLIIRASMTEKPFIHKKAFANVFTNFIYHEDFLKIFKKLINKKGIINVGGKSNSVYNFAKKDNKNIRKIFIKYKNKSLMPINSSMNLKKLKKIL